jgi:hypothetical protein
MGNEFLVFIIWYALIHQIHINKRAVNLFVGQVVNRFLKSIQAIFDRCGFPRFWFHITASTWFLVGQYDLAFLIRLAFFPLRVLSDTPSELGERADSNQSSEQYNGSRFGNYLGAR